MNLSPLLLSVAALLVPVTHVQTFALNDGGARIGTATCSVDPAQHSVTAHIEYKINGLTITLDRKASFDPKWEQITETTSGKAGEQPLSYTAAPNSEHTKLNFDVKAAGQTFHADFTAEPRTVSLANFDPSGIQVLIYLMAANPHPEGQFWAFAPMGRGALVGASFKPDDDMPALGKDGAAIKHWTLTLASVQMEIYADRTLQLLAADIPEQSVSYVRDGFVLPKPAVKPRIQ